MVPNPGGHHLTVDDPRTSNPLRLPDDLRSLLISTCALAAVIAIMFFLMMM